MTRRSPLTRHLTASQKAKRHWSPQKALGHWIPEIDKETGKPASPRPANTYRGYRRNAKFRRGSAYWTWWYAQNVKPLTTAGVGMAA